MPTQLGHGSTDCFPLPKLVEALGTPEGLPPPTEAESVPPWAPSEEPATVPTAPMSEKYALVPERPEVDAGVGALPGAGWRLNPWESSAARLERLSWMGCPDRVRVR